MKKWIAHTCCIVLFYSCTAQKQGALRPALATLMNDTLFAGAHAGVCVYNTADGKFLYEYQADKYFVPASNVKIATCYTAMKYLKHILPGIRYYENDTAVYLVPTGDPTLLHRDFPHQPVIQFLQQQQKKIFITDKNWKDIELGNGWSWDDFSDDYMTERNALPVYGNTLRWVAEKIRNNDVGTEQSISVYSDPEVNWKVRFQTDTGVQKFNVQRERMQNVFKVTEGNEGNKEVFVPFITNGLGAAMELLPDTIGKTISVSNNFLVTDPQRHTVWSQPTDSVLRPMMYNSDNFFAEQLLLMASEEKTGVMEDRRIIDTVLHSALPGLKNIPVWVDGCGLSRYNLFTPRSFVSILDSMRREFGMDRLKTIFPTGGTGTLKRYFSGDTGYVYAKTGSMSGVVALSGFVYTKQNRLLIFSILINNYNGSTSTALRRIERFVEELRAGSGQ